MLPLFRKQDGSRSKKDRQAEAEPAQEEGRTAEELSPQEGAAAGASMGAEQAAPVAESSKDAGDAVRPLAVQQGSEADRDAASHAAADAEQLATENELLAAESDPQWSVGETAADALAEEEPPLEAFVPQPAAPQLADRSRRGRGRRLAKPPEGGKRAEFTAEQRLLLLDTWTRSGLPAKDFGALVGVGVSTLQKWKRRFEEQGPEGLMDRPRGSRGGSRLSEVTKRAILMLKQSHPEWGCERISDMLRRGPALPASASAVARVLKEAGYESVERPTRPHRPQVRRFERARPNALWQTDLFTFVLKRQNRRVYLVAFMDDNSRFLVSYGLHASQSTALVLEVLEAGISSYGPPEEILTDNGPQYVTWRGKSQFSKRLEQRGIRQIVARPKRPQTLGKIERFWGTLWRECIESAVFLDLADARRRIGLFIDWYNFQRAHRGVDGLVPADRFFQAAPEVLKTLKQQVASNALELARHGVPAKPFYLTGQLEGKPFSVHREGERLILMRDGDERIELAASGDSTAESIEAGSSQEELPSSICPDGSPEGAAGDPSQAPPLPPGQSAIDEPLANQDQPDVAGETESEEGGQPCGREGAAR
jgi:transposase InsO family protein